MSVFARILVLMLLSTEWYMSAGDQRYIAAVVEHGTIYTTANGKEFSEIDEPVDAETALKMMMKNLDQYEVYTEQAKQQRAQIIVFPENGIHGFEYTRESVFPFLQHIPDPKTLKAAVVPCEEQELFKDAPVVRRLSCMAKQFQIVIVANLGDVQYCPAAKQTCKEDGRLQFNTDVVLDSDGVFLLKYHKHFLYHEDEYDTPDFCSYPTFTPSFGVRFAVVTCFDLMFDKPTLNLVHDLGIKNIAFPTAWPNFYPLMASYAYHQAWSRRNKVNLLAANHHRLSELRMTGSGIYSQGHVKRFFLNHTTGSTGQLLVSELSALDGHNTESEQTQRVSPNVHENFNEAMKGSSAHDNELHVHASEDRQQSAKTSPDETFKSILLYDEYDFIKLKDTAGNLTICNDELCCNLLYEKEATEEMYALGVFTGVNKVNPAHLSVCGVLRCAGPTDESCGEPVLHANTVFKSFILRGNFSQDITTFPITLVGDGLLVSPSVDGIQFDGTSLGGVLEKPLLSAFLFGRTYDKDIYYKCRDPVAE